MELRDKVVIVTGGGGGIGEALSKAFAADGAAGVAVADIDGDAAERAAAEIEAAGGTAFGVQVDAGNETDVLRLVSATEARYGDIDLFAANAGIMVIGGVEVPDKHWERIWNVNVQSHIYAARAVLPGMLARGSGYLLHTASAAGLLTQIGSAPYSVSKHAVVGLAEWLSITHHDAGIRVSCLCPQAVATAMAGGGQRPEGWEPAKGSAGSDGVLSPEQVAAAAIAGLATEEFLILPHPEVATYEQRRAGDRERWLRAMRRANSAMMEMYARFGRPGASQS